MSTLNNNDKLRLLRLAREAGVARQTAPLARIARVDRQAPLAASYSQQRLWFLSQFDGASDAYHIADGLLLEGPLDRDALRRALNAIYERHEALRTAFEEVDGVPLQRIASGVLTLSEDHVDEAGLASAIADEASAPFDLARGPLIRARLLRLAARRHALLVTMHHIVSDGWSMGVFIRELGHLYSAYASGQGEALAPLPVQYADYAAWQRGQANTAAAAYWKQALAGAPALIALPTDRARPPRQNYAGAMVPLTIDAALTQSLKTLSARHGATLFMTLCAAWALLLQRLTGQDDLVIGTPVANRGHADLDDLIGFFVNTVPLRLALSGAPTLDQVLARVAQTVIDAQQHQQLPFEQMVELAQPVRSMAHAPLFQVMFAWDSTAHTPPELAGLNATALPNIPYTSAKFDLTLALSEHDGLVKGGIEYASALFDRSTVERFAAQLQVLLASMVAATDQAASSLAILPVQQRHQLLESFNATDARFAQNVCIHELFEQQAARTPDAIALVFEDRQLSYAELNHRANRLAHTLVARGVRPDARVAVCAQRSVEMVVALYAVLKAGGAYVPLDPAYPVERLAQMLADSAPVLVLTQNGMAPITSVPLLVLDESGDAAPCANPDRHALDLGTRHLAYVIYTSGSTGLPKGVMNEHGAVVNRLLWMAETFGFDASDRVLQKTPYSFDVSVWEFFLPLIVGARLVLARPDGHRSPDYLAGLIDSAGITALHFVPSMLQAFVTHCEDWIGTSVKRVFCSGEALSPQMRDRFRSTWPAIELHNLYGPTEAAIDVTWYPCADTNWPTLVPIGRPIANTRMYILDSHGQPVPLGVVGEIHIGGVQVARGYLHRPELTAERFVADPFSAAPGARMYKTGDLGRWLADGNIDYLGRNDFQVKVRGFRIELGEIEAQLGEHADVREVVVLARRGDDGDATLVAYYVASEDLDAQLRTHLAARLPAHMLPSAYVRVDAMPLTSSGKLDRKALPAPDAQARAQGTFSAPRGDVETTLAALWCELLKLEQAGRDDHFFDLGGHSLLAVTLVSRLRRALAIELRLDAIFAAPLLCDMAQAIGRAQAAMLPPPLPVARDGALALSYAQQRLWFLSRFAHASEAYHIPDGMLLNGPLDRRALRRALDRIVARHEALRTVFDEGPAQRILPADTGFALVERSIKASELPAAMAQEAVAPFDLANGPLVRGQLLRLDEQCHALLVTAHHLVWDGWSHGVFNDELRRLYDAFAGGAADPLAPLPIQYADYAAWERALGASAQYRAAADYWSAALSDAPQLINLPLDHPRPAQMDFRGGFVAVDINAALTAGLRDLARRHGSTLFMTMLAAWAALLQRLTGEDDIVIGTPMANRNHADLAGLIGFFANTLALRIDLSGAPDLAALMARVKAGTVAAQQHQSLPFEQVVELIKPTRSMAHTPLFQVALSWQGGVAVPAQLTGLQVTSLPPSPYEVAKFDLTLAMADDGDTISGGIEFASALFDHTTVQRFAGQLRVLLAAMVAADAACAIAALPVLPDVERHTVLERFNPADAWQAAPARIDALFAQQVARRPHAIALEFGERQMRYVELDQCANRLAHYLIAQGVGPDRLVAICMARGIASVVAMLATLKAGGAYLPLDPAAPEERQTTMIADAAALVLLSDRALSIAGVPGLTLDAAGDAPVLHAYPSTCPAPGLAVSDLAYVIYTSGSTGAPKGVMVEHRNLASLIANNPFADIGDDDCVTHCASPAFDATAFEVWTALLNGARLLIVPQAIVLDGAALGALLIEKNVSAVMLTTGLFNAIVDDLGPAIARLRYLGVGGEAFDVAPARRLHAAGHAPRHLLNLYGPTEAAVIASAFEIRAADIDVQTIPIGQPLTNTRIYILDALGAPVPLGVTGELHIGGAGVARGYLYRPALTAARFVADPFAGVAGARMYKTGDRARWRADGSIEFAGRDDGQVKLRGFRIELGEIEAALCAHEQVGEAVVVAQKDVAGTVQLLAYFTSGEVAPDAAQLRDHLAGKLPEYMLPVAFVHLARLPLTPNGKLDRAALPAPSGAAIAKRAYSPPQGPLEITLAALWCELLKLDQAGRDDHFFELGGHSLLAVTLVSRLRRTLGVEIGLGAVFAAPLLRDMARALGSARDAVLPPIALVPRQPAMQLSYAQQRLWFLARFDGASDAYHVPDGLLLDGQLDRIALGRALDRIVARHEALRTVFVDIDGGAAQRILRADTGFTLREGVVTDAELADAMAREAAAPFDLANGPLVRGQLLRLGEQRHALLVTTHHIVSDGWSMGVFNAELSALYSAFAAGDPDPLPALPVQYADYAVWQRALRSADADRAFWRQTLAGAPPLLELPLDHARPAQRDYLGGVVDLAIDAPLTAALKALSLRHGCTLFMTMLAAWAVLLHRLSGQDDIVIGAPVANRKHSDVEGLIGFFANTLALRIDLAGAPDVAQLLARVKAVTIAAQQHQDLPFEQVVEVTQPVRSMAHSPLFQTAFAWNSTVQTAPKMAGLRARPLPPVALAGAKFDLTLALADGADGISGGIEFASALFERATAQRFADQLLVLLQAMAASEMQPVASLPILTRTERSLIAQMNQSAADFGAAALLHQALLDQIALRGDATAVVTRARRLSYRQLGVGSARLAAELVEGGATANQLIAVVMHKGWEQVVAVLGILRAGAAYLPIDAALPKARILQLLALGEVRQVVTCPELAADIGTAAQIHLIDDATVDGDAPPPPPQARQRPSDLAYVIFTSGSTGTPKGVMIDHRGARNTVCDINARFDVDADDAVLGLSSLSFDLSVYDIFGVLGAGGRLVLPLPDEARDPQAWLRQVEAERISLWNSVPALMHMFAADVAATVSSLRLIMMSGDWIPLDLPARLNQLAPNAALISLGGATEASIWSIWHPIGQLDPGWQSIPYGRPLANQTMYVLQPDLMPAPIGVVGELYIGGIGVALGYWKDAAITARSFIVNPHTGERLYRTGDLGRLRAEGWLEFLGRRDQQVKLQGFRIELGEIEALLLAHADVLEATVLVREDGPGDRRLVAYVTAQTPLASEALRQHLRAQLPHYMVPAAYVQLDALPLSSNGKVDRKALPAPAGDAYTQRAYVAPEGAREQALAAIWCALLQLPKVGRNDHFFELGGHSMKVVELVNRARKQGLMLALQSVFHHPVLADMAAQSAASAQPDEAVLVRAGDPATPLFMAHDGHGELLYAFALAAHLPPSMAIYGLPAIPADAPQPTSIAQMAARMVGMVRRVQPSGPYRLAGWSFGGALAHEIAAQLAEAGEALAFVAMLDTYHPSALGAAQAEPALLLDHIRADMVATDGARARVAGQLARLADAGSFDALLDQARDLGIVPRPLRGLSAAEIRQHVKRKGGYLHAYRQHKPASVPALVHLFPASEDNDAFPHNGWHVAPSAHGMRVQPVAGSHDSMLHTAYVAALGAALAAAMESANA